MAFDIKKATKTDAQERPELIIAGDIVPVQVEVLHEGQVIRMDRQMLTYQIPINSYVDTKGVQHLGLLDACGIVRTKAGKDLSGVAMKLKPITFDETLTVKNDAGVESETEVRLQFEPTWRGLWTSLKVVQENA